MPGLRERVGCPIDLALVLIAERFGGYPWEIEDAPADRVEWYMSVMGAESEGHRMFDDIPPDEAFVLFMDD